MQPARRAGSNGCITTNPSSFALPVGVSWAFRVQIHFAASFSQTKSMRKLLCCSFYSPFLSSHRSLKGRKMKKIHNSGAEKSNIYVTVPESETVMNTNFPRDGAQRAPCAFHFNRRRRNGKKRNENSILLTVICQTAPGQLKDSQRPDILSHYLTKRQSPCYRPFFCRISPSRINFPTRLSSAG
jgi:hypothetical protein